VVALAKIEAGLKMLAESTYEKEEQEALDQIERAARDVREKMLTPSKPEKDKRNKE
jgi:hypothetical protein